MPPSHHQCLGKGGGCGARALYRRLLELLECTAEFLNPETELRRLFGRVAGGRTKGLRVAPSMSAWLPGGERRGSMALGIAWG